MKYTLSSKKATELKGDCLILAIFKDGTLGKGAGLLDKQVDGDLSHILSSGDMTGKLGSTYLLPVLDGEDVQVQRLLLVGCGDKDEYNEKSYRKSVYAAMNAVQKTQAKSVVNTLATESVKGCNAYTLTRALVEETERAHYQYSETLGNKPDSRLVKSVTIGLKSSKDASNARKGLKHGEAIGRGTNYARDLGNFPGNVCTPTFLEKQAKAMAKKHEKLSVKVLQEKEMEKLGMGALLSVSKGSREPAKLIIFKYDGGKKGDKPHMIVGKGLTFDAGGISIKPSARMDEMKYDMCGGASVFGTIQAIAEMGLKLNVVGMVPASENMPDGAANKPGDVVTNMEGITIEVLNTDAEGRLILCDSLSYAKRYEPKSIIDIATLTGACVIALGAHHSGLMSFNDKLANDILKAGDQACDTAWRLPLSEEYHSQLKSNFADVANVGGRAAGTITAGRFLSMFTKGMNWAHLDIAGVAWKEGAAKGGTGRPVSLLTQYLMNQV